MKPAWTAIKTKARHRRFLRCSGKRRVLDGCAVYTDHINTPRLVTLVNNPLNPVPITDTSNDLAQTSGDAIQGISPLAMPVWQMAYSSFGVDLANCYEAKPTTINNNFKPDLWEWLGLPETGGAGNWSWYAGGGNGLANGSVLTAPVLNIRYPGQYYDAESGLSQNWWRSYDARMGRYTQNDPIGLEGGMNRFGYVGGDGINYSDSMGLRAVEGPIRLPTPTTTPDSQKSPTSTGANFTFGAGGSCHLLPLGIGVGADAGGLVDTSGNVCVYSNICYTVGPGYSGGLGLVAGVGTGLVQTGSIKTQGATWTGGAGLFGSGPVLRGSDKSKGYGRGVVGIGGGGMVGYQSCQQVTICTKN